MKDPEHPDEPWGTAVNRAFDARVRDLHEAPFSLDQVKDRAHAIRRHRRLAAAGGVLAAVAVIIPTAIVFNGGNGLTGDGEIEPAAPPRTEALPAVGYVAGTMWHQPDDDAVSLRRGHGGGVIWNDHLVAHRIDPEQNDATVDVIDQKGKVVDTFRTNGERLAVNTDRSVLAYVTEGGDLVARWADRERVVETGLRAGSSVGAIQGGPTCEVGSDCTLLVTSDIGCQTAANGVKLSPPPVSCQDAHGDLLSVTYDTSGCDGILDSTSGAYRLRTCAWSVRDFSPDGRYVAAVPVGSDPRYDEAAILSVKTHEVLATYDAASVVDFAWTVDGAALALKTEPDGDDKRIVLLQPDGTATDVGGGDVIALIH